MYLPNEKEQLPFVAVSCVTTFDNDNRVVVLNIYDDLGLQLTIRVPEGLMADVTGQFLRERLFGLH